MRTSRTLTVFRWRTPPENLEDPPKKYPPRKFGGTPKKYPPPESLEEPPQKNTPPENLEEPPQKNTPPKFGGTPPKIPPPVNRMTDRCKNITLAKTSFRPVNMV